MRMHHTFRQHQVPQQIQHFVPGRLVGKARCGKISLRSDSQGVAGGCATRQAGLPQCLQFVREAPGPRRGNLEDEPVAVQINVDDLGPPPGPRQYR